jgi:hypothetical protein
VDKELEVTVHDDLLESVDQLLAVALLGQVEPPSGAAPRDAGRHPSAGVFAARQHRAR